MKKHPAIVLRPFRADDVSRLIGWISSPEQLFQWAGPAFRFPLDERQLRAHLAHAEGPHPSAMPFCAWLGDEAVGHGELFAIDREHESARITRVLVGSGERRGLGIGRAIVAGLLQLAFDELRLHRVELGVYDFNLPAIRAYEALGFRKEGLRREVTRVGENYWSSWTMALLSQQWRDQNAGGRGET